MTKIATKADCNNIIANSFDTATDLTKCPTKAEIVENAPLLSIDESITSYNNNQCVKLSDVKVNNYNVPITVYVKNNRGAIINITWAEVYAKLPSSPVAIDRILLGSVSFDKVGATHTASRTLYIDLSKVKDASTTTIEGVSLDNKIDLQILIGRTNSANRNWTVSTDGGHSNIINSTDVPWIQIPLNYGTGTNKYCLTGGEGLNQISSVTFTCLRG